MRKYRRFRIAIRPVTALALASLSLTCSPKPRLPDVILITIDTVRADRIGAWGDAAARTPVIDALASAGALFSATCAQVPLTAPSHASILTGTQPTYHGVRKNGGFRLDPAFDTLPEILRDAGYETGGFVSTFALNALYGFDQGFSTWSEVAASRETMHSPDGRQGESPETIYPERTGEETVSLAIRWLEQTPRGKPLFLWVHLYDPHHPYAPPAPYAGIFPEDPYRGEIAAVDREIGRLLDALPGGRPRVTAVVSDHGEAFGEKGEWQHGFFVYETTMHVPMLLVSPGRIPAGAIRSELAQSVDLFSTLLALAGVRWTGPHQGADLFAPSESADRPAYGETLYGKLTYEWSDLRMGRRGDRKYIASPHPELYDLAADPGETVNILPSHREEGEALQGEIAEVLKVKPDLPESAGVISVSREEAEALAALGYIGSARVVAGRGGLDEGSGRGLDPRLGLPWSLALGRLDTLAARGEVDSALTLADRVAAAVDAGIPIRLSAGGRVFAMKRYDRALAIFKSLQEEAPDRAEVWLNLGACYLSLGRTRDGRDALGRAIALDPRGPLAHLNLARLHAQSGEPDSALLEARTAHEIEPTDAQPLLLMTKLLIEKGHAEEAYRSVLEASRLDPDNKEARDLRFQLERAYPELKGSASTSRAG